MPTAIELPGTLSLTQTAITDVGNTMNVVINSAVSEIARSSVQPQPSSFSYYIQSNYDINSSISYNASSATDGTDDAYSMTAISVTDQTAASPAFILPSVTGVTVSAGLVDAQTTGTSIGTFPVTITFAVSTTGVMTSSIAITGSDVVATATEDSTKAQIVYWSGINATAPSAAANDADVLTSTLTSSQLETKYSSELTTINNQYNNQNMIASWTISFPAISANTNNLLSQWSRYLGLDGSTNFFSTNDMLVTGTAYSYGVSVNNYLNTATTIITPTSVFGVLVQT